MERNLAFAIGNLFLQVVQLQTQNEALSAQIKEAQADKPKEKEQPKGGNK